MDAVPEARYTLPRVIRRTTAYAVPRFARVTRSDVTRWLAVLMLAPMMAIGAFGGAQLLAHGHDDLGTHLHPVGPLVDAGVTKADHAELHGHDHAVSPSDCSVPCDCDERGEEPGEAPRGVIVSLSVHKQRVSRGTEAGKSWPYAVMFVIAVFVVPPARGLDHPVGSPGGVAGGGPMDRVALSAIDRLVRTSRALLI